MCGRGWRGRGGFPLGNYFREETRGLRRRPPDRDEGFGLGGGWFGVEGGGLGVGGGFGVGGGGLRVGGVFGVRGGRRGRRGMRYGSGKWREYPQPE